MAEKPDEYTDGEPPSSPPKVEGKPLMAWMSETLQAAGVVEEDPVAGLLVEMVGVLRRGKALNADYAAFLVEGAVRHYAGVVKRQAVEGEAGPTEADLDAFVAWLEDDLITDDQPLAVLEWAWERFRARLAQEPDDLTSAYMVGVEDGKRLAARETREPGSFDTLSEAGMERVECFYHPFAGSKPPWGIVTSTDPGRSYYPAVLYIARPPERDE